MNPSPAKIISMTVLAALTALVLLFANVSAAPPLQTRSEQFEFVPCSTFKISNDAFECGYVRVPEFHADPNGKQIKLAVAILPGPDSTSDASAARNAFVVAQGGPGGSTLDTFANFFANDYFPALKTLNAERDIVLYDQRGTLFSQPSLMCREELDLTLATIDEDLSQAELLKQQQAAALECRARLLKEDINLAAYNSIENARDVEAVRRALGYDKFDFYGISYGTLLALHAMRESPETFRSVILDAVVPAQLNPNADVPRSMHRAFEELFSSCAQDAACQRAFPNLKQIFYETVDALNRQPARVTITDSETGKTYDAVLDGDTYMNLLFQLIYNSEVIPALPKMIHAAHAGQFDLLQAYWPLIAFDRTFASGMYYSVMCAEDADFTVNDLALDGVDTRIAAAQKRDMAAFLQLCRDWDVPQLGAHADAPVQSNIPTLVFSGNFDPITPPPFGQAAAENIEPSYSYIFPAYGHGAMASGNCPNEMIADFIRDPQRAPNAQCMQDIARVSFITPATHLLDAQLGQTQLALLQGKLEKMLVPVLALFTLFTVFLVAPLVWLIRQQQHQPPAANRLARLAPWFAVFTAITGSAFLLVWIILVLVQAFSNEHTIVLLLGAPRSHLPLYFIPLLTALSALALCAAVIAAWLRGNYTLALRVYYTMLAGAAVALALWFAASGMLTVVVKNLLV